jgi:predicted transcriptional regulator
MLGDSKRGLSAEEVAELFGYALSTVRAYLSDDRRKLLGKKIRENEQVRALALQTVFQRRACRDSQ